MDDKQQGSNQEIQVISFPSQECPSLHMSFFHPELAIKIHHNSEHY